ncbi:MAG TPA: extracellular solute-binding protein [Candidatus Binatia bacterium]|jgi:iron(III) transport system substrate-binding protein
MRVKQMLFICIALNVSVLAFGQDSKLIDAAKKEGGKVVIYGSFEPDTLDLITAAFQRRTGLQTEYWRAQDSQVMDRALSEYRTGKPLFDIVLVTDNPMRMMSREGILARYDSPSAKDFPKDALDRELGPRYRNFITGIIYNKDALKTDIPKTLDDLLKPQFKGKLVMADPTQHAVTIQWLSSLHKLLGKDADNFIKDLGASKPILVQNSLIAAERVSTGETPIAISQIKFIYTFGKKGAPLDYVRLGKFLGDGAYAGISAKAVHPSAARAFVDFFLDEESMNIIAKEGEFVNRRGIYPPIPDADKIQFVNMVELSAKDYAAKKKDFQRDFMGR